MVNGIILTAFMRHRNIFQNSIWRHILTLKGSGWSIFLVRGNFPREYPIAASETSNNYGQWLSPEDAERITKSCNLVQAPRGTAPSQQQCANPFPLFGEAEILSDSDDEDLKAAIAASLMDSHPPVANSASSEAVAPKNNTQNKTRKEKAKAYGHLKAFGLDVETIRPHLPTFIRTYSS
ncbi:hypothetical protein RJ641_024648 [Dillenia turbinata]|uniref:Uncharacterized protein n=1 Tax=Dillenia turbinata TaxID=194707 RepID=A0AAN8ZMR4_9MAGN